MMAPGPLPVLVRSSADLGHLARLAIVPVLVLVVVPVLAGFGPRAVAQTAPGVLSSVYFSPGATQIRPRDMKILDAHATWLRGEGTRELLIEGHSDEPRDSAFSRKIGDQRARSVKAYLVSRGVVADRITTVSRGGGSSPCREQTPTCRSLKRRATFSTEAPARRFPALTPASRLDAPAVAGAAPPRPRLRGWTKVQ